MYKGLSLDELIEKLQVIKTEGGHSIGQKKVFFQDCYENPAFITDVSVGTNGSDIFIGLEWDY